MAFPVSNEQRDKPGAYHKHEDVWLCDQCGYVSSVFQGIVGHQGKHRTAPRAPRGSKQVGRPTNMLGKNPMSMTLQEAVDTIEELREELKKYKEAVVWREQVKSLFSNVNGDSPTI